MIALQSGLEGQIWQIILDSYRYDEDTYLFLNDFRNQGAARWALQRARNIESDLVFMKYRQGINIPNGTIRDANIVRRVLELAAYGADSGKYLGPSDDRLVRGVV
ncbi:hypothetical protein [Desulfallas thermosapovorans]|uniref:Uncharacterized protein n=1 Tax=Desulfallas thermosapovorans DSM 6562 TaxID=1121431 RepID=A0A5S4ZQH4_9FIRM|nr:hypothetical protein [Desulfallas thermosapovorans]TYO95145.1 hypothetical protein LX24_01874 [Desulfallas thermosapovorans DSM 6562]